MSDMQVTAEEKARWPRKRPGRPADDIGEDYGDEPTTGLRRTPNREPTSEERVRRPRKVKPGEAVSGEMTPAKRRLNELVNEQADLDKELTEATYDDDMDHVAEIQRKLADLPGVILVAKVAVLRERLAKLEARKEELAEEHPKAKEVEQAAFEELRKAQEAHRKAQSRCAFITGNIRATLQEIGQVKLELTRALDEIAVQNKPKQSWRR